MQKQSEITLDQIKEDVRWNEAKHVDVLRRGQQASFEGLRGFQYGFVDEMAQIGLEIDQFEGDRDELLKQPARRKALRENPSAHRRGPKGLGKIAGKEPTRRILIFGPTDKSPAVFERPKKLPDLIQERIGCRGLGSADDVARLASRLSAEDTCKRRGQEPDGDRKDATVQLWS